MIDREKPNWYINRFDGKDKMPLLTFAAALNDLRDDITYIVDDTYFDYGQNWVWTTVIANKGDQLWQAISPAMQQRIMSCFSISQLYDLAEEFLEESNKF